VPGPTPGSLLQNPEGAEPDIGRGSPRWLRALVPLPPRRVPRRSNIR